MPTEKRARQRALRDQKMAIAERKRRRGRLARRGGTATVFAAIVIVLVVVLAGHTPAKKPKASSTTTTVASTTTSSSTSTTIAAAAIAPTCPPAAGAAKRVTAFTKAPATCISPTATYAATVQTDVGTFVVTMPAASSEAAVNNFVFLARYHFFDGTVFHRVIPGFVVQGGDPTGTGTGGPGYSWTGNTPPASCKQKSDCYPVGGIAMANSSGPSTNGSQFFVVLPGGQTTLDTEPNYTLFGTVTSGMNIVEKIGADGTSSGTPKVEHHIIKVTITQVAA